MVKLSNTSVVCALVCFSTLLAALPARALADTTTALFKATSDATSASITVSLKTNDDHVATALVYVASDGQSSEFDLKGLAAGIVLVQAGGQTAATLKSGNFDPANGGELTLNYIYNGISGEHRDFVFELDRQGTDWATSVNDNAGRRTFHSLYLKAKKFLGKVIGIASITAT
jgi:hypothetical protein